MEKEKEMSEFFIDVLENGIAVSKLTEGYEDCDCDTCFCHHCYCYDCYVEKPDT